jgi:predicted O-methyltransferase YrrM
MNIFLMYRHPLVYVINLVKAAGCYIFGFLWIASSVGLEHYFDRVGVTGSSPVQSTILNLFLMTENINQHLPTAYNDIGAATRLLGFTMASDILTCSLLRTLAASKPAGKFLELGTGSGLSTSWILDGMDNDSTLISIDNDSSLLNIAGDYLGHDERLSLVFADGGEWMAANWYQKYDYIFADTWHGKYLLLNEALAMLKRGGLYIIDDMLPQPNWPDGHAEKAQQLIATLEAREDLVLTKQVWATGIIVAVKK